MAHDDTRYSIKTLLINLGWTRADLARHAGISYMTASKAVDGEPVKPPIAKKIADAIGQARGEKMVVTDIADLHVIGLEEP